MGMKLANKAGYHFFLHSRNIQSLLMQSQLFRWSFLCSSVSWGEVEPPPVLTAFLRFSVSLAYVEHFYLSLSTLLKWPDETALFLFEIPLFGMFCHNSWMLTKSTSLLDSTCLNRRGFDISPADWTARKDHRNHRDCISRGGFGRFRYLRGYHFG